MAATTGTGWTLFQEQRLAALEKAAPELLAALKECADLLDDYSDVNDGDDGQPVANRAMVLLGEIERVIARAEGRA